MLYGICPYNMLNQRVILLWCGIIPLSDAAQHIIKKKHKNRLIIAHCRGVLPYPLSLKFDKSAALRHNHRRVRRLEMLIADRQSEAL